MGREGKRGELCGERGNVHCGTIPARRLTSAEAVAGPMNVLAGMGEESRGRNKCRDCSEGKVEITAIYVHL
jgi:hypothetical protein